MSWHIAIVGLSARHTEVLTARVEAGGWRASRLLCTEGVLGALAHNPANVYVTAVSMPAEPLRVMTQWIRNSVPTRDAVIIAVARSRTEEREAERAGVDHVLRAPLTARSLANDVMTRIAIEEAIAHAQPRRQTAVA